MQANSFGTNQETASTALENFRAEVGQSGVTLAAARSPNLPTGVVAKRSGTEWRYIAALEADCTFGSFMISHKYDLALPNRLVTVPTGRSNIAAASL